MAHDGTSHPPIPQDSTPGTPSTSTTPPAQKPPPNNDPVFEAVSFQDHPYALESPWVRPDSSRPVRRLDSDPIGETRNMLNLFRQEDESAGVTRWAARVLRVENMENANEGETSPFSWFDALSTSYEENPIAPITITALTDAGVHATAWGETGVGNKNFRLPTETDPGTADVIDKIRDGHKGLFVGVQGAMLPRVGELVWVTWADLANHRDGLYLGPVVDRDPIAFDGLDRNLKHPCDELNSQAAGGLHNGGSNAGANSNISYRPRKKKIDAKKDRGKNPVGKGVFTGFPDIKTHKVKQATQATLSWVCYTGIKQAKDGKLESAKLTKVRSFSNAYHKKGIRTYLMGYPSHGHEEPFLSDLFTMASKASAIGIIINLDHYYNGLTPSAPYERENYLMTTLRDLADKSGFCIGLTATDIAKKKEAPWKIFADNKKGMDFAIPQVLSQNYSSLRDNIIDKNDQMQQPGPTVGQPTYFDDIYTNNFVSIANLFSPPEGYASLEDFKTKWYARGFDKSDNSEKNTRSLYLMGAAEIVEKYWKSILPGSQQLQVEISSHIGGRTDSGNHIVGGATDIMVRFNPGGKKIPALQVWASLMKLQATGRIPAGGTGLYLNVSSTGIKGVGPEMAGKGTPPGGISAPGGSANPHYDMRGFLYSQGKSKNTQWVMSDSTGNGKDNIDSTAASRKWLRRNRPDVAAYVNPNGTWGRTGNYSNGYLPPVGGEVLNLKQLFGLESSPPPIPKTAAEDPFVTYFKTWKKLGFKHIVPALGMVGNSPQPNGWRSDGYNTPEKSPWRMREDAAWTFTSVKEALGKSMANSVIWWDWAGASVTSKDWPEKRWDIIRELGDAVASAQKISEIKSSSLNDKEKNRIIGYQLGSYLRQSPSPGEELQKAQEAAPVVQKKVPEEVVPTKTNAQQSPTPSGLSAAEKKQKQGEIDKAVIEIKNKKEELEQAKTELRSVETSDDDAKKKELEEKIIAKTKEIKEEEQKVQTLRSELSQDRVSGNETPPQANPIICPGAGVAQGGSELGRIDDAQLSGVIKSPTAGTFVEHPLTGAGFIVIHNPGGTTNHEKLAAHFRDRTTRGKGFLGVHFSVDTKGIIVQHASLKVGVNHAPPLNYVSYGIEVLVTPGPSLHGSPAKDFKLGPAKMYEATYKLVRKITTNSPSFKRVFPEYNKKEGLFYYGHKRQMRGVISHASFNTDRTDGKIEVLYMALRARHNYSMMKAYNICKQMHEVAKGNPLRYDNSGKQEDGQGAGWIRVPGVPFADDQQKTSAQLKEENPNLAPELTEAEKQYAKGLEDIENLAYAEPEQEKED